MFSHRPRRLRQSAPLRNLVAQNRLAPADLVLPAFVKEGTDRPINISSMPGVQQHSMDSLKAAAHDAAAAGVGGIMLFGVPEILDAHGTAGVDPHGILNTAIAEVMAEVGDDIVVMADTCLDEFTDHGHCGVLDEAGNVANDETNAIYAQMAVVQAEAGVHVVSPSGMMDGQVGIIREALDAAGHQNTAILAYSAKYASAFYGPFREAVDSALTGDRKTYQMDSANRTEAVLETELDVQEGADMVMVKPAMSYLDILRDVANMSPVPVAAYQISGEYAMIEAAAANGWIEREPAMLESLTAIRRAGAQNILTYYATEAARLLA